VNENYTLGDLGVVPNGTIQLQLQSTDAVNHPLQLIRPRQEYHMPDVITVRIHIGMFLSLSLLCGIQSWKLLPTTPIVGGNVLTSVVCLCVYLFVCRITQKGMS